MKRLPVFLAAALLFLGCGAETPPIRRAVYHWKGNFDPGGEERQWLQRNDMERIYLRLFDIDWDENLQEPVPVGVLQIPANAPQTDQEIVPTFFIANRCFQQIDDSQTDSLADRIVRKARTKLEHQLGDPLVREWQFDCDWSESTRDAYFRFLRRIDQALKEEGVQLSATIRLHQVKYYRRTGVPPVDRGMLMFYNMGDLEDPQTRNSILDLATARNYYYNFDTYPLPLDLALPLFNWGVALREGKMVRLINGLAAAGLQDPDRFSFRSPAHVEVKKSTYLDGYYLYQGDEIRLESVDAALLQAAARDLKRLLAQEPRWLCFYHLDSDIIKQFTHEDLESVYRILER